MPLVYPIKLYVKHPATAIFVSAGLAVNAAIWVWMLTSIPPQSEQVFLHYNIFFGVDAIGSWGEILSVPISGLVILLANGAIGWALFARDKYFAHFLNAAAFLCQLFLLAVAALLITLNT